ncbi:OmpA family protein [Maribacter sp. M208]|uniref:OmpA family protein n=1 Tax=Maribacter huludaoensis TaxID=3030010 RepID=UPI0023ECD113|nr:OmpA family protein [Maribacter huludaoensis]MDF4220961.1 OmpA family protein [Maribacter huludaoensis]
MKVKTYIVLFSLLFIASLCYAQRDNKSSGTDNFEHYGYMGKESTYEELSKKGMSNEDICKNLGNEAYLRAKYDEASYWYAKLLEINSSTIDPDYMYRYAQSLKSINNYKDSEVWMKKFKKAKKNDVRALKYDKGVGYFDELMTASNEYTIENLTSVNSKESDFAPSFYKDFIVFSTARDLETTSRSATPYLNLYKTTRPEQGEYSTATHFSDELKSVANESSTSFSQDGNTMYFTRNNYKKGSFNRDKKGVSRLKIYRSTFKDGKWGNIEDLPFNSDLYSVAHPALSKKGDKLYFSSDMPGTLGASDIFVVDIHTDGSFGTPVNLGSKINTESKETFPFITASDVLYFASDGHPGLGGLDIFSIDLANQGAVKNLGNPINSANDDFSMIFDETTNSGFFASDRNGGLGADDIYALKTIDCMVTITGIAVDKDSDKPLPFATVHGKNNFGGNIGEATTNAQGKYTLEIPCQESQYTIIANLEGYEEGSLFMFTTPDEKSITNARVVLEESSKVAVIGADLVKVLKLAPIYFDLNSSYLRDDAFSNLDKVVAYMKKRPEVKVEVGSHTDSREEDNYNLWLSDRRAKRTVEYIIAAGIEPGRISGKGYGETQIINKCANGIICSDRDHQLNRRSEFILIE